MSIPIDKLYHYIDSIARKIRNDIIIYRFYPHGSKKIEDLSRHSSTTDAGVQGWTYIPIYCYDQEPLSYMMYANQEFSAVKEINELYKKYNIATGISRNIRWFGTIFDRALLLHSEQRSNNLNLYTKDLFISVYYWSHAIISLDWFRYARYETLKKNIQKQFLIYNRAWSGSREYRLKFVDLLIHYNLINKCHTTFNPIEPELNIHYSQHNYVNKSWLPNHLLEYYIPTTSTATSSASADYVIEDYNSTDFEVVLETLFDDDRIQLTEKALRPIALGQPFLLAATHGSLEYLRSYGFKTFATVIDESYDTIEDPMLRLVAIVKTMVEIANWTELERTEKMAVATRIAEYNRKHFFSSKFIEQVTDELKFNLFQGFKELEATNTSSNFFAIRKKFSKINEIKQYMYSTLTRQDTAKIVKKAREYYRRSLGKG